MAQTAQGTGAPLVALVTTSETAALTIGPCQVNASGAGIMVRATVSGATGASVTSCQVRIRKGTDTSGAVVGGTTAGIFEEAQGASSKYSMNVAALDTSLGVASAPSGAATYTVTVQQVGASGNGTVTLANLTIEPAAVPQ